MVLDLDFKTYLNILNISKHVFSLARLVFSCLPGDHLERLFNEAGWLLLVTTDLGGWTLVPDGGLGYPKMVGPCCFSLVNDSMISMLPWDKLA